MRSASAAEMPPDTTCWIVGPSFPGLLTRIVMFTFAGAGATAVGAGAAAAGAGAGSAECSRGGSRRSGLSRCRRSGHPTVLGRALGPALLLPRRLLRGHPDRGADLLRGLLERRLRVAERVGMRRRRQGERQESEQEERACEHHP